MVYEAGVAVAVLNYIVMAIVIRVSQTAVICVRENVSCVCECRVYVCMVVKAESSQSPKWSGPRVSRVALTRLRRDIRRPIG